MTPPWLLLLLACRPEDGEVPLPVDDGGECEAIGEAGEPVAQLSGAPPTNLLVISIDTLRRDRVGRYSDLDTTPFLDALFDESLVLDDFRACANWTLPGVSCAMTGVSPLERGVDPVSTEPDRPDQNLSRDLETLATWLRAAGYDTRLATGSRLFSDDYPIGNGFTAVDQVDDAPAEEVVSMGIAAVASAASPWYVHLHFRDPHSPYAPPVEYQGDLATADLGEYDPRTDEGIVALQRDWREMDADAAAEASANLDQLYEGEVRYVDDQIAALWAALEARGALDDTLVVFWSDHGEQFFEHHTLGHEATLHPPEAMAIGAFWARSLAPAAWAGPTTQVDVPPTVLGLLGVPEPAGFTGWAVGAAPPGRVRVSSAVNRQDVPIQSADQDGWRLQYTWTGEKTLFDLADDPSEMQDAYRLEPRRVRCLWEHLLPAVEAIDPANAGMEAVAPGP